MYTKSSVLFGDVIIAPYGHDAKDMDFESAPKLGFGVAIAGGENLISDTNFAKKLKSLAIKDSAKNGNIFHQVCGHFYSQDRESLWFSDNNKEGLLSKIGQWAWVGIPCASVHSPNEIICPGDEYWTSKFYQKFYESDIGLK